MIAQQMVRRFATAAVRKSSHHGSPMPGDNLPFRLDNPYKVTAIFGLFLGSSIGLPFIMLKFQLTK